MNKTDLFLSIPEASFPDRFKNREMVRKAMKRLEALQASHWKKAFDFLEDKPVQLENYQADRRALESLKEQITHLENNIANTENVDVIKTYTENLNKAKSEVDRITNKLERRDEIDLMVGELQLQNHREFADGIDAWVEKLGNWFATGVLGSGTVTYRDKTYTAE
jgi:tRNA U34 5-carboxymethylaminomethyl modifying GTPase MnmE/TrmE